ncbi:hypothetical protein BDF19DRAFT_444552 [Syncephalis fuscata]|nr:hypothetical protein BDF19DRAFT_444552 [Syncephalis fuscata]
MASGFGIHGGRGRCFTMWQEFRKCYAQAECPEDCEPQLDDYNECLTHKKETERAQLIQAERHRQRQAAINEKVEAATHASQTDPTNFMARLKVLEEELKRKQSS